MVFVAEQKTSLDGGIEEVSRCPVALSTCLHLQLCVCVWGEGGGGEVEHTLRDKTNNKTFTTNAVFFNSLARKPAEYSFGKSCFYTIYERFFSQKC